MHYFKSLFLGISLFAALPLIAQEEYHTAPASLKYSKPQLAGKMFVGGNYRDIWMKPVRLRVFYITKEKGGFKIDKMGGGMQTKNLRMIDKDGAEWSLRTVDKTVDKAMDAEGINNKMVRSFAQQSISAAMPYGALTIPPMAQALGINHTAAEVFFVPDDPALGKFRKDFANTVCLLEKREPVLYEGDKVHKTEKALSSMRKKKHQLDTAMMLQARLLDMLVADWDRHGDQWKWEYHKTDSGTAILPIPRDHDQAYFLSTGAATPVVRMFTQKHIVGFRTGNMKLVTLNRKEWAFDKQLIGGLSEQGWEDGIKRFQAALTDDVLNAAVKRLPAEICELRGDFFYQRLRKRRDAMLKQGMAYYRFLQKRPEGEPVEREGSGD
jgi:hypothetical protein